MITLELYLNHKSTSILQDAQDPNPLIRALAVRTMGCIRVDKITEYLCEPLRHCLKVYYTQLHEHSYFYLNIFIFAHHQFFDRHHSSRTIGH